MPRHDPGARRPTLGPQLVPHCHQNTKPWPGQQQHPTLKRPGKSGPARLWIGALRALGPARARAMIRARGRFGASPAHLQHQRGLKIEHAGGQIRAGLGLQRQGFSSREARRHPRPRAAHRAPTPSRRNAVARGQAASRSPARKPAPPAPAVGGPSAEQRSRAECGLKFGPVCWGHGGCGSGPAPQGSGPASRNPKQHHRFVEENRANQRLGQRNADQAGQVGNYPSPQAHQGVHAPPAHGPPAGRRCRPRNRAPRPSRAMLATGRGTKGHQAATRAACQITAREQQQARATNQLRHSCHQRGMALPTSGRRVVVEPRCGLSVPGCGVGPLERASGRLATQGPHPPPPAARCRPRVSPSGGAGVDPGPHTAGRAG